MDVPRIAVVGCGRWGRNIIRNMSQLGALAAVVNRPGGRQRSAARSRHTQPARGRPRHWSGLHDWLAFAGDRDVQLDHRAVAGPQRILGEADAG